MKLKLYLFLSCIFLTGLSIGQSRKERIAQNNFDQLSYVDAIKQYDYLIKKGNTNEVSYSNLADSYYNIGKYEQAYSWYKKLDELPSYSFSSDQLYRYSQTLKAIENYEDSNQVLKKLQAKSPGDLRVAKFSEKEDYLQRIEKNSNRYNLKNLDINSASSDFAPSLFKRGLLFASNRDSGVVAKKINTYNNNHVHKQYIAQVSKDTVYTSPTKYLGFPEKNELVTTTSFSKDGNLVYFTRNVVIPKFNTRKKVKKSSKLKIFRAEILDSVWTNIKELSFNSDSYSTAHPSLSMDEKTLYFSSDMPGGKGQTDIYKVSINEDGTHGTPVNLGSNINTESAETFPFIAKDSILYFSSNGHPGLGGLDVFAAKMLNNNSIKVMNVGAPLNSNSDDFSYVIDADTKRGFFSSGRVGGKGEDDIYGFLETKKLQFPVDFKLFGVVTDQVLKDSLALVELSIYDSDSILVAKLTNEDNGTYKLLQELKEGSYTIKAKKEGYKEFLTTFNVDLNEPTKKLDIVLEPNDLELTDDFDMTKDIALGTDLKDIITGTNENIYFDFDDATVKKEEMKILDKLVAILKQKPEISIQIKSHTDARGSMQYNKILSQRRADNTMAYLVENGILADRLTAVGMGESELLNDCVYGTKCTEEAHRLNRRSEFIVVKP